VYLYYIKYPFKEKTYYGKSEWRKREHDIGADRSGGVCEF
jgi:hypothetical protein